MGQKQFVELSNVSLVYGRGAESVPAIEQLTLSIGRGDFIAVVGPSGCGKSTLMKLVTGLLPPTAGTIFVGGKKVNKPVEGVGMAFQNSTLMPWRTTLSNIMLPFEIVEPHKRRLRAYKKEYVAQAEQSISRRRAWQVRREISVAAVGRDAATG